jgi:hypothetical protein
MVTPRNNMRVPDGVASKTMANCLGVSQRLEWWVRSQMQRAKDTGQTNFNRFPKRMPKTTGEDRHKIVQPNTGHKQTGTQHAQPD